MEFIFTRMPRAAKFSVACVAALWLAPMWASPCAGNIYLTLDTGNMSQAEAIAKTLNDEKITATFFLANELTYRHDHALDDSWGDYWRARVAEGHVFGNHTWSHAYARRDENKKLALQTVDGKAIQLDQKQFCAELRQVDDAFHKLSGRHLSGLWRAPGGRTTQNSIRWAASCGYPLHVGWDEAGLLGDELPSEPYPNALLLERALKSIQAGDVLLLHLGIRSRQQPLAPILKPLIQGLKARGLCFATLDVTRR